MKSRRLALLVAIALGGGGFLSSAQSVSAADVTGNNVTIDDTQAPSNNAKHPGGGAAFGTAAGFIKDEHDNGNVKDNTLTFKNLSYDKQLYGGLTFGTGNVTGNKVVVNQATSPHQSISDGIFGGSANGGGNVEYNHATFNGNHLNGDLVGGMATDGGTGTVKKNTATLKGGNVHGSIYGGTTGNQANGDVLENEVLIEGGSVTGTGNVYGGYTDENSNVKGNIVTIKGGVLNGIYGGYSSGTGEVSGNTVNLGDGTSAMAAGYAINGTIYGGRNDSHPDKVSNNTLNVNANAVAYNIKNVETINFNFNAHMNTSNPLLKLTDSNRTKIKNLDQLHMNREWLGSGTLIENANGIDIESYTSKLGRTGEKTETIIDKDGTTKISYKGYRFKGARAPQTEGTDIWGGRSVLGNTTTDNEITLSGNHTGKKAYGGWTSGTGSTATGENAQNHSIGNKITLTGATSEVHHMTGGATNIVGGKATGNHAILSEGRVTGNLTGGSATNGEVSDNTVEINGGRVDFLTYGGVTGGTGTAKNNKVTLTNGTVHSDIYGGVAASGNAEGNIVNIKGGSAANHDVYGGFSTNGDATGNTVTITGGSVRNVDGGRSLGGNATGNTVNIGSTDAAFAGSITGIINGGSGTTYGNDYRTGNKLNVYGNATATNIKNFAELNFHFNAHVMQTTSFLTLSDTNGTEIQSLGDINVTGTHGRKGTLLKNTHGITITDTQHRLVKTTGNKELVLAKSLDNQRIDYEGYAFAHQTAPTTVQNGPDKYTWGGRSVGGNSTHDNEITVNSDSHTNVYGGWTSGTGSDVPADQQKNSALNKIKVSGAANITGTVYGGFTDVTGGKATGNTVTVEKNLNADIIGGKAAAEASGNTVNVTNATVKSVTGGEGTTTTDNTVNLNGATVNGAVKGGTVANGTDNTLNVKGMNTAQSVEGFQTMSFDTTDVAANRTMLNVTGGTQTKVNWNTLTAGGNGRNITLMRNNNGIDFGGTYTVGAVKSGLSADKKSETNISVSSDQKAIEYTGYQFTGVSGLGSAVGGNLYGGISKAGNATHHNNITVNSNYDEVYGGHTSGTSNTDVEKKNSHDNTVTITGGTLGKVYGGYTEAADGTTEKNTVNLGDGTNALAPNTTIAEIHGGSKTATGNTLNVNTAATVGTIGNFSKVTFKENAVLRLQAAGVKFDLAAVKADFAATAQKQTLVESSNALDLAGGKTFRSELNADRTRETNIEASTDKKKIVRYGYTLKNATTATTVGADTWGGRSAAGNTTTGNALTLTAGAHTNVYGGWTSGTGSNAPADQQKNSTLNKIKVSGAANVTGKVYGGFTDVAGGKAMGNTVTVEKTLNADIIGGKSASGEASGNTVTVGNVTVNSITGGDGATTNDNIVNLNGTTVTGTITGGTVANSTGNTLNVKGKDNKAGTIANIQKMNFDATGLAKNDTMLEVTGAAQTDVNWANLSATGTAAKPLTLLKNASGINLTGYTGAAKSVTTETTETNVDVRKTGNMITEITYEGYQFKGVTMATADGGNLYGGISKAGNSTRENAITVNSGSHTNVYGGHTSGSGTGEADKNNSYNNTVTIAGGTVTGKVYGGYTDATDGKTYNNTVNLNGGNLSNAEISGGNKTATGNTLNVNTAATVGKIENFSKVTFKENAVLRLQAAGVKFDLAAVKADFAATAQKQTLVESSNALDLAGGKTFRSELNADRTRETNIEASTDKKKIVRYGYTLKNATTATTDGSDTWGGRSAAGHNVENNAFTLNADTHTNVYGGWTTTGVASNNTVTLGNITVTGNVTGGAGTTTNDNIVNLNGTTVTGTLTGGTAANGTGNTLNVKGKDNKAGTIANIQKMNFDASGLAKNDTMLEVTGTAQTDVNWANLSATGTAMKPLTLLKNANGINLSGYTGAAKSVTTETTETNVDVRKTGNMITEITYEGYQFKGVTMATADGGNLYGGISKAGNSTRENAITVNSGSHTNVYGGHTSGSGTGEADKNNSYNNTVTITGGTVSGTVYGGYTEAADGKTYNNTVNLNGGNLSNAEISGGNSTIGTEKGNTLNVNTAATVKKIDNFQTVTFKDQDANLTLTGTGVKFDLAAVKAGFDAAAQEQTLVQSSNALELAGGKTFRSDLSADGTKETNIEARESNTKIVRYGYTFKNATTATTIDSDTWGGRSAAGNTTTGNVLTLKAGAHTNVYGGWTSGTGSKAAADQGGDSTKNSVTVKGTATVSGTVYGGYTGVMGGKATGNTVTVEKTLNADIIGGKAVAEASSNTVNVTNATVKSITGGSGTVTNDNRINLRDAKVTGMVTGGTAANGTGNTLNVSYGTKTTEIGDYKGIRNLHFDMEKAPMDGTAHTMLRLTNVGGAKSLSHTHIDLHRDGAAPKLQQGDKITLMENAGGDINVGENLTAKGTDGVTRNYEFALATVGKTLIATVTKTGLGEQFKSIVETRAGASAFLNDGGDYLVGSGMEAAKKEARAAAQAGNGAYGLWAGMGGGALRHKTGSYVDMKGWNLGVGWARENAVQAGSLTFGPFIEYGRGSYDSYLDDGTHGSGKTSFFGAGVMAKLETGSHWIDGSLRVGRTKSDYTGLATYDTTSTYYGVQVGAGKDYHVNETDTVGAYVRYSYTHTAGTSAHLSKGETYDFDAVNSHRLRIGTRYTHGGTVLSQIYAGLAWEYEFDGDARATYQGDSAPSPSLKGGSALLELGYRFAPQGSRMSYDLNLTGWQGKRQGITGGLSVKWAF